MLIRLALCAILTATWATASQAETYLAGQAGANFPQRLSQMDWSASGTTVRSNDFNLAQSGAYGIKIGHYLDSFKWIGVESDLYYSTPSLKQQNLTIAGANFGTAEGIKQRMVIWAPLNFMIRIPIGPFEPYAGGGAAASWSHLKFSGAESHAVDVGYNGVAGLRIKLMDHVGLFGEYKYVAINLHHRDIDGTGIDIKAHYRTQLVMFGVSIHF